MTPEDRQRAWRLSYRSDPFACALADRHYNRRSVGSPWCGPPGRTLVLTAGTPEAGAAWVSSLQEYSWHDYPGSWVCSLFRNESPGLSSELIISAVAHTRWKWGEPPASGMVTFVNPGKVRSKRDPGYCFLAAGFERVGATAKGLVVLQLFPERMSAPRAPGSTQLEMGLTL